MDNINTPKREPTAKKWVAPEQRDSIAPVITGPRYEESGWEGFESQFNNIPDNPRLRNIPQLIPLIGLADRTKRFPHDVTHSSNGGQQPQITKQEIINKARLNYSLKDTLYETDAISTQKVVYNIFSPIGLRYTKSNEGSITNQPVFPGQTLNLSSVIYYVNNLSNAGTNYE